MAQKMPMEELQSKDTSHIQTHLQLSQKKKTTVNDAFFKQFQLCSFGIRKLNIREKKKTRATNRILNRSQHSMQIFY